MDQHWIRITYASITGLFTWFSCGWMLQWWLGFPPMIEQDLQSSFFWFFAWILGSTVALVVLFEGAIRQGIKGTFSTAVSGYLMGITAGYFAVLLLATVTKLELVLPGLQNAEYFPTILCQTVSIISFVPFLFIPLFIESFYLEFGWCKKTSRFQVVMIFFLFFSALFYENSLMTDVLHQKDPIVPRHAVQERTSSLPAPQVIEPPKKEHIRPRIPIDEPKPQIVKPNPAFSPTAAKKGCLTNQKIFRDATRRYYWKNRQADMSKNIMSILYEENYLSEPLRCPAGGVYNLAIDLDARDEYTFTTIKCSVHGILHQDR